MRLESMVGIFALGTALVIGQSPANAQLGGGVFVCSNCSTEPTQLSIQTMHNLEYAKQLLQYAIQVQQLADAIRNTAHGGPAALTNVAGDLNQLAKWFRVARRSPILWVTRMSCSGRRIRDIKRQGQGRGF